jgi:hypothetical protein
MHRFKLAISPVLSLLVLGALSGPALAKRQHPRKPAVPAEESPPATEMEADSSARPVVPGPPAARQPSEPVPDKTAIDLAPAVAKRRAPAESTPMARDPAETATRRERSRREDGQGADRLTGHVGVGSPLVTLRATRSTQHIGSVNEDLTLVAPIGLGLMITDRWTFDFELQVSTGVRPEGLTTAIVDPGIIYAWDRLSAGLRVGWQLNANQNVGLIPLVRFAVLRNERANWFVEAALPSFIRNKQLEASAALQTGVGF